jgi:hypothetical protein
VIWRVWAAPSASRAQSVTDATGIGNGLIPRPRAASTRPETPFIAIA